MEQYVFHAFWWLIQGSSLQEYQSSSAQLSSFLALLRPPALFPTDMPFLVPPPITCVRFLGAVVPFSIMISEDHSLFSSQHHCSLIHSNLMAPDSFANLGFHDAEEEAAGNQVKSQPSSSKGDQQATNGNHDTAAP